VSEERETDTVPGKGEEEEPSDEERLVGGG
jgi:hypothetical protein